MRHRAWLQSGTGDGAMDDTADIAAARDDMTPPVRRRAFTSGWNTAVAREPTFDFSGIAPQEFIAMNGLSIQVLASN